jgi:hypothetical protein
VKAAELATYLSTYLRWIITGHKAIAASPVVYSWKTRAWHRLWIRWWRKSSQFRLAMETQSNDSAACLIRLQAASSTTETYVLECHRQSISYEIIPGSTTDYNNMSSSFQSREKFCTKPVRTLGNCRVVISYPSRAASLGM